MREREGDVPLYERSEFKLLFLLPLRERREGEVFVPPYKSQYPLVSAVERERTKIARRKGRIKVGERERERERMRTEQQSRMEYENIWYMDGIRGVSPATSAL